MKTLHISIDKKKVIEEVQLQSAYIAAKAGEPAKFKDGAINDYDDQWIKSTFESCHVALSNILSEYIVGTVCGEDVLEYILEMPDNIHPQSEVNMNMAAAKFYIATILAEWLNMTMGREIATGYMADSANYLNLVRSNIHRRNKPIRRPLNPF